MGLFLLRAYLLAGLVVHKLVWEVMKRRHRRTAPDRAPRLPLRVRLTKLVKLLILAGITAQILVPEGWTEPLRITEDPALLRLGGLVLYTAGLATAVLARLQLGRNWSDIETATVLAGQRVIDHGIYRYVRHPIYVGDLLLLLGLELSLNAWLFVGVVLLTPFVLRQALREERMLVESLPGYAEYCARTKRFIPFLV